MAEEEKSNVRRATGMVGHVVRRGLPLVILVAVLLSAYFYWRHGNGSAPEHVAPPPPQEPIAVSIMTVRPENVPARMRFLGLAEGAQVVEIRARVAGYLQERTFVEGEQVTEGQKLFQIDPRPFEVEVAQARAGLAMAQATLERATQQLNRFQRLTRQGAVALEEFEDWQTQRRVAAADVQQQQAQLAAAELQLQYASIESPITGMIGRALKDNGSYVDTGQNGLLAVVQQVDPIYVRYSVTEQEVLRFQKQVAEHEIVTPEVEHLELEITLADGSTHPFRGKINFVDVQVDRTTGTSIVRGEVPNPDGQLKPGQFIYASVLGIQRVDVLRVPQTAVTQAPTGASVMVVNDKQVAESRPVELGEWSGTEWWIIERGLMPGDRVIVDQLMMVRPGTPVAIAREVPSMSEAEGTDSYTSVIDGAAAAAPATRE